MEESIYSIRQQLKVIEDHSKELTDATRHKICVLLSCVHSQTSDAANYAKHNDG